MMTSFVLWVGDFWFGAAVGAAAGIIWKTLEQRRKEIVQFEFSLERILEEHAQGRKKKDGQ